MRLTRVGLTMGIVAAALATSSHGSVSAAVDAVRSVELRVMTWNIQHGIANGGHTGGPSDLERVAAVIRAEDPDVVTLNEVHDDEDFDGSHGHQPDILRSLLEPAGYAYSFFGVSEVIRPWFAEAEFVDSWTVRRDSADGVSRPDSYGDPTEDHPDRRIDYCRRVPVRAH